MQNTLILILAILGICITLYISIAHALKKKVVCPITKNCNIVLDSKYSKTFGIKNELIGLAYYLIIFLFFFYEISSMNILIKIASIIALIRSINLFYTQYKILKNYCFWCITTAIINFLISILILTP
jgi:uncharacterized membrane protein